MLTAVVLYFLAVVGLGRLLDNNGITVWGSVLGAAAFLSLLLVVTPRRMWEDSQREVRRLEQLTRPKIGMAFVSTAKPYFQEKDMGNAVERAFRIGIRNDASVVIPATRVVIESCDPDVDEVWIERPLHVMGQNDVRDRCDVSPGDRPTAFVNFIYQTKLKASHAPGSLIIKYASEGLPNRLPAKIDCKMVLRAEGGGTFSKKEFWVRVDSAGSMAVTPT